MNTPVYCTNNTRMLGNDSYLYLPSSWCYRPLPQFTVSSTILDMEIKYRGLYITAHGYLWSTGGKSIWRIVRQDSNLYYPLGLATFYLNHTTRLWHDTVSRSPILAEEVSYDELRLEAIFLLG